MHLSISSLFLSLSLFTAVLASPTLLQGSRTVADPKVQLKQATRDSIVTRARNPFRRADTNPSCGSCLDCCAGYCRTSGQIEHAVYANTGLPIGYTRNNLAMTTQPTLDACIRTCCGSSNCDLVRFVSTTGTAGTCEQYYVFNSNIIAYSTADTPGTTIVANRVSCSGNAPRAGSRACCNAPITTTVGQTPI